MRTYVCIYICSLVHMLERQGYRDSTLTFGSSCHVNGLIIGKDDLCCKIKRHFTFLQHNMKDEHEIQSHNMYICTYICTCVHTSLCNTLYVRTYIIICSQKLKK